jgi:hypothetical protein
MKYARQSEAFLTMQQAAVRVVKLENAHGAFVQ